MTVKGFFAKYIRNSRSGKLTTKRDVSQVMRQVDDQIGRAVTRLSDR